MNCPNIKICQHFAAVSSDTTDHTAICADVLRGCVPRGQKNELWQGLPKRLATTRKRLKWSLRALMQAADSYAVDRIEDGENVPTLDTVERIACALGVPPCWLAFGDEGAEVFSERRPRSPVPPDPPEPSPGSQPFHSLYLGAGTRLLAKREAAGLSLRELAESAGVSFETIRKCETGGAIPKVDTCERLAVALGVAPCWLAFGVGAEN